MLQIAKRMFTNPSLSTVKVLLPFCPHKYRARTTLVNCLFLLKELLCKFSDLRSLICSYKVAEFMYGQNKLYGKALVCRMKDPDLKVTLETIPEIHSHQESVFDYTRNQLDSSELTPKEKSDVRSAIITNIKQLVSINSSQASRLILQYFSSEHEKLLRALDPYPGDFIYSVTLTELQYAYLSSIMNKEQSAQTGVNELLEQSGMRITSGT